MPDVVWSESADNMEMTLTIDGERRAGVIVYTWNDTHKVAWFTALITSAEGDREFAAFNRHGYFDTIEQAMAAVEIAIFGHALELANV